MSFYSKTWAFSITVAIAATIMQNYCVAHTWTATACLVLIVERITKHDPRNETHNAGTIADGADISRHHPRKGAE